MLHFQMEPLNALAVEHGDVMEIHTGNQWQSLILPQLALALGRDESKVVMRTYPMGGGFGRRLNGDYAIPAALAAQALGRPVKMILTREDDARFDSPRSASVQTLRMAFDAAGAITAMEHHAAAGWPTEVMAPFFMPKGVNGVAYDPFAISGADHWYEVGAQKVRAGWGTALPEGWARGIACGFGQERAMPTWVACVAQVMVDSATGMVTVQKLTSVTDAGTIIDPDSARAQTEGALLWGLSMALYEGTEFVAGQERDTNLNTYTPLRMGDLPTLDISFIDSPEVPVGLGEPSTTVVAPAIANAIFAATGARVTHLPIQPAAVRAAIGTP